MTTFQKIAVTAVILAVVGVTIQETRTSLARRNQAAATSSKTQNAPRQSLRQKTPPTLRKNFLTGSALPIPTRIARDPPLQLRLSRFHPLKYAALLKSKVPTLTPDQVKKYLDTHDRNATNLLAAYRTSGDPKLLAEALEKFPKRSASGIQAAIRSCQRTSRATPVVGRAEAVGAG